MRDWKELNWRSQLGWKYLADIILASLLAFFWLVLGPLCEYLWYSVVRLMRWRYGENKVQGE